MKTRPFKVEDYITPEIADAYMEVVIEDGDTQLIKATLKDMAKIKGMTTVAREANLNRESLYKSLSENGNPSFETIVKVARALGYKLTIKPA